LQHSWNLHCTSTKIYENFTEGVNSLASKTKKLNINIRVWNKTISYGSGFPANPILSALIFFWMWVVCLPAYPIFCCLLYDVACEQAHWEKGEPARNHAFYSIIPFSHLLNANQSASTAINKLSTINWRKACT
jgi:hypothetical protein